MSTSIGFVKWEITAPSSGSTLGEGEREVEISDVEVRVLKEDRTGSCYQKLIPLSDHFRLGIAEFPKLRKRGFGMVANRDDFPTFCWEWFTVRSEARAAKHHEHGELDIHVAEVGSGLEVVRTEFRTDVSFRVIIFGEDFRLPKWRVNILKGSSINWPSLIDGKLKPNEPPKAT